jgi:hypothetical protein
MTHRAMTHHASAHMAHRILSCDLSGWRFRLLRTGDVAYQQEGGRDQYQLCFHGLRFSSSF